MIAPVNGNLRAFGFSNSEVGGHAITMLGGHEWTHLRVRVRANTDRQSRHSRLDAFDQLVATTAHRHEDRRGHTPFTGRAITGAHRGFGGVAHVRVRQDHHMILRATKCLHPLAFVSSGLVDVTGHGGRSHKTDRRNPRMSEDPIDRNFVTMDHVEDPVRDAGFGHQFREEI